MRYYSGVGSRETPNHIMELITQVAAQLPADGYCLRSGGADGADAAFEAGVLDWLTVHDDPHCANIYLPWFDFNGRKANGAMYIDASKLPNYQRAVEVAESIHPAWERLSRGARALHTRNVYQVLGNNLASPSSFLICWAVPKSKTEVNGGTNTAVQLALKHKVPVFNLWQPAVEERFRKYVKEYS